VPRLVYLPIAVKTGLPDLVVEQIRTSGGALQVVIRNIGKGPAGQPFWVDLYINLASAPARVNQIWNTAGSQGLVWAVSPAALPLAPGSSLTLSSGDQFFQPDYSRQDGLIQLGTPLYAQADSYNASTSFGAVLETHELDGGPYNNIGSTTADASVPAPARVNRTERAQLR
jgi:hypothetical protein